MFVKHMRDAHKGFGERAQVVMRFRCWIRRHCHSFLHAIKSGLPLPGALSLAVATGHRQMSILPIIKTLTPIHYSIWKCEAKAENLPAQSFIFLVPARRW